jgi:hypothetical protein
MTIFEIPRLLEIWRDPKTNITMYKKDILKDWSSPHLLDYGWYLDYPKENILPSKFKIRKKYELEFLQGLGAIQKRDTNQEENGGGQEGGKDIESRVCIKYARQGRCSHSIRERGRSWLEHFISS